MYRSLSLRRMSDARVWYIVFEKTPSILAYRTHPWKHCVMNVASDVSRTRHSDRHRCAWASGETLSASNDASISVARAMRSPGPIGLSGASGMVTMSTSMVGR